MSAGDARNGPGPCIVVNAYGPEWPMAPDFRLALDDEQAHGGAVLDALMLEAGNALLDSDFELELVAGSPAQALVEVAENRDADEIVIGSRGFGRVRATLGSVSHEVLHRADRPVVVIPYNAVREHQGAQS